MYIAVEESQDSEVLLVMFCSCAWAPAVEEDYWRASEASETLSGLFNRESRYIYYSTYVCHICPLTLSNPYNPLRRWNVILKLLPQRFVYV